ncbi:MAG: hypothetical protein K9J17_09565, partial [Flavobacteriales bacterium]|nr:hypothetical protein [Flavobacteriales bacterium]
MMSKSNRLAFAIAAIVALTTNSAIAQVSKTNSTPLTVSSGPSSGSRTVTFTSGDFGGCTSLTEVEISITLDMGSGTLDCNAAGDPYATQEDLALRITSPSGTNVDLIFDKWDYFEPSLGNTLSSFTTVPTHTVLFDDDAASIISGDWSSWTTAKPVEPLSGFDGENAAGVWTISMADGHSQFSPNDFFCMSTVTLTITCGASVGTWDGSSSTDWNTASNWSADQIPTASDNITIPSAPSNQPHVTLGPGSPAMCNNISIETGATLTVDAGKALTVGGTTANAGTIIVKADATGIGSLITTGAISGAGSFQMEQYLTGSGGGTPNGVFYYVSSPIPNATAATYNIAGGNKLWIDDESSQTYPQLTFGAIPLEAGQGYIARMGSTGTTTFNGSSFNTGNQSETGLTRTGTTELNRGYNLVGNPYPST